MGTQLSLECSVTKYRLVKQKPKEDYCVCVCVCVRVRYTGPSLQSHTATADQSLVHNTSFPSAVSLASNTVAVQVCIV